MPATPFRTHTLVLRGSKQHQLLDFLKATHQFNTAPITGLVNGFFEVGRRIYHCLRKYRGARRTGEECLSQERFGKMYAQQINIFLFLLYCLLLSHHICHEFFFIVIIITIIVVVTGMTLFFTRTNVVDSVCVNENTVRDIIQLAKFSKQALNTAAILKDITVLQVYCLSLLK